LGVYNYDSKKDTNGVFGKCDKNKHIKKMKNVEKCQKGRKPEKYHYS
jgi:hypothetical protein